MCVLMVSGWVGGNVSGSNATVTPLNNINIPINIAHICA